MALIWLLVLISAGSGSPPRRGPPSPNCRSDADCRGRFPHLDRSRCDAKGKRVVTIDVNGDGRPDVWKLYLKLDGQEVLTCTQSDLDSDGAVDLSRHVDPRGVRLLEELDLDHDGQVDQIVIYQGSKRYSHTVGPGTACVSRLCTLPRK